MQHRLSEGQLAGEGRGALDNNSGPADNTRMSLFSGIVAGAQPDAQRGRLS